MSLRSTLMALLLSCSLAAQEAGAAPAAVLHISDAVFDWGTAFRGEQLEHTFELENRGTAPLLIESLKPNCGCMILPEEKAYKRTLQPGEKLHLVVRVDTHVLEPTLIKSKYTDILSNAASGENRLWVQGQVVELFKLDPSHPTVEVVKGHTDRKLDAVPFHVNVGEGRKARLASLRPTKGLLTVDFKELEAERRYLVTVKPTLKDEKTQFQNEDLEARVEIDGKALPFRIPVAIKLKSRIEVTPSQSVFFHRKDTAPLVEQPGAKVTKPLEIQSLGGSSHHFKITGVKAKEQVVGGTVEAVEEGKRYRLVVTLLKRPEKGERFLKDVLEITTDDPEVPVITIPASAQF